MLDFSEPTLGLLNWSLQTTVHCCQLLPEWRIIVVSKGPLRVSKGHWEKHISGTKHWNLAVFLRFSSSAEQQSHRLHQLFLFSTTYNKFQGVLRGTNPLSQPTPCARPSRALRVCSRPWPSRSAFVSVNCAANLRTWTVGPGKWRELAEVKRHLKTILVDV